MFLVDGVTTVIGGGGGGGGGLDIVVDDDSFCFLGRFLVVVVLHLCVLQRRIR